MIEPLLQELSPAAAIPRPALVALGLSVFAGERALVRDVGLAVPHGELLALVGPSGAGKSTLLRCFNRLVELEPSLSVQGEIELHGESIFGVAVDVDHLRRRVGMLFQQPVVFPGSVVDNVCFGLRGPQRPGRRQCATRCMEALEAVGLAADLGRRLDEPASRLSVGQQQRLCLARALVLEPEVLLLDEPTSALDPRSTATIEELVASFAGRLTRVLVTHSAAQAERLADRAVALVPEAGGSRAVALAPREIPAFLAAQ